MRQAVVALIIRDGLILGISRRYDKTKFGLVGGKVDADETLEAALNREVFEESSVILRWAHQFFHREEPAESPDGEDFECYCFYASEWKGDPKTMEEGEIAWLTAQELTSTKAAFPDYNTRMLEAFRQRFPDVALK